jgi:hypothetical protein
MKKPWIVFAWILIVTAQIAFSYSLVYVFNTSIYNPQIETASQFLLIPIFVWLISLIGFYGIGMVGLAVMKVKPLRAGLRFLATAIMALFPMLILVFNAFSVGIQSQTFQDIIMRRMVPYYSQLDLVFALLGFYITLWWKKSKPKVTPKTKKR